MRIFLTGSAGFIGFHLVRALVADGHEVVGFDGMTSYYDPRLKQARLDELKSLKGFRNHIGMLEDMQALTAAAEDCRPEIIIHLAAQAGVRYGLDHPRAYVDSNMVGTFNLLEVARRLSPGHLLMASTSSVYGGNPDLPYGEGDRTDFPLSLYAATKKAGEAMSHAYAHLWKIPTTCFRFFTVYGPWGRPDMALFKFVEAVEAGRPIDVYGEGRMSRDFTYVGDLTEAVRRLVGAPPVVGRPVGQGVDSLSPVAPWRTVNIGSGGPIGLMAFIKAIERALGLKATLNMLPRQQGDMADTFAGNALLKALTGYAPATPIEEGVAAFVDWYRQYRPSVAL